jgi:hypothetical protein
VPEREHQPHSNRTLAFLHQFAGDVVDGSDVVDIDSMAKTETACEKRRSKQDWVKAKRQNRETLGGDIYGEQ